MIALRRLFTALAACGLLIGMPQDAAAKGPMMIGILGGDLPGEVRISVEDTERFRLGPNEMFIPGSGRPARLSTLSYILREYWVPGPTMIRRDGKKDPLPGTDWIYYPAWDGHEAIARFGQSNSPSNEWWRLSPAFEHFVNAKIAQARGVPAASIRGRSPKDEPSPGDDFPAVPVGAGIVGASALGAAARWRRLHRRGVS